MVIFSKKAKPPMLMVVPEYVVVLLFGFWFTAGSPSVDWKPFGLACIEIPSKLHA